MQNLDEADLNIDCVGRHKPDGPESSLCAAYHNCPNRLKIGDPPPPADYLTHFPKHPGCETCITTKTVRKQHRKSNRDDPSTVKLTLPTQFGSILVADHLKLSSRDEATGCRNHALGIMDRFVGWSNGFPSAD